MRLLSFTVANYRSFFNEQTMVFNRGAKNVDAVLGPNGSGKTNFFQAIGFFRDFIRLSTKFEGQTMFYQSFLLNSGSKSMRTRFESEMQTEKYIYRYSFSLLDSRVVEESLSRKKLSQKATYETLFRRASLSKNRYEEHGFASSIEKSTRPDALVLTKAWENNNKYALEIFEWLDHLALLSGGQPIGQTAQRMIEDPKFKNDLLDLLRAADLYIQDVAAIKVNMPDELFSNLPIKDTFKKNMDRTGYDITTTHFLRDASGKIVGTKPLSMGRHESMGTRRIFELAFPLLDALEKGSVLYIDEFETYLHPRECQFIIDLFTNATNKNAAQIIVNTHNTEILDQVGRNSIHLFGKNNREETVIGEIPKDIRSDDAALEKKYNKGMFGAVPNINK